MERVSIPDRTGVVLGYRVWYLAIDPNTPVERSLQASARTSSVTGDRYLWRLDGPTVAECGRRPAISECVNYCTREACCNSSRNPPEWGCHCGLYAFITHRPNSVYYNEVDVTVYGVALVWGKVIYHEYRSFLRASKMLPIAFMELPEYPTQEAMIKLRRVSFALRAPIFSDIQAFQEYAEAEAERW